jgi:hypothetical protein
LNGILRISLLDRDGQMADFPREQDIQNRRLGFGAKAGCEQLIPHPSEGTDNSKAYDDDEDDQFRSHGYCRSLYKVSGLIATGPGRSLGHSRIVW